MSDKITKNIMIINTYITIVSIFNEATLLWYHEKIDIKKILLDKRTRIHKPFLYSEYFSK